jgi:hypothetical protein
MFNNNARANLILTFLFSMMFVLWLISQSLQLDIYFLGLDMYRIQTETEQLRKENLMLQEEALHYRSYTIIYTEATSMGFTKAHEVVIK